ncbi:hypothetical protein HELRODRAFT_160183 [Helobdella robusta]|uniref:Uncharacterized protein n=1 Tax=Helobdella robusta TaxID=6412 RepID=T1EPX9_HELRO|nr:hypothetical protein HELRODRAFT_160183 [Helobdella robusta]ESO06058.1 hypothetical protein HELRODRAFT_160183 [Helobdella robusta]
MQKYFLMHVSRAHKPNVQAPLTDIVRTSYGQRNRWVHGRRKKHLNCTCKVARMYLKALLNIDNLKLIKKLCKVQRLASDVARLSWQSVKKVRTGASVFTLHSHSNASLNFMLILHVEDLTTQDNVS